MIRNYNKCMPVCERYREYKNKTLAVIDVLSRQGLPLLLKGRTRTATFILSVAILLYIKTVQ